MGKNVFVGPHRDGGWQAKKAGNAKASAVGQTQAEMIERGRELAKNERSELVVQGAMAPSDRKTAREATRA
ncbi:MAG: DUF2188 domain-containing protein, partial [Polyangia bacterium]